MQTLSEEKLENLILIILQNNPMCKKRLNLLLWLIDKQSFLETGSKVTGATYLRKKNGPEIDCLDSILDKMLQAGKIAKNETDCLCAV